MGIPAQAPDTRAAIIACRSQSRCSCRIPGDAVDGGVVRERFQRVAVAGVHDVRRVICATAGELRPVG